MPPISTITMANTDNDNSYIGVALCFVVLCLCWAMCALSRQLCQKEYDLEVEKAKSNQLDMMCGRLEWQNGRLEQCLRDVVLSHNLADVPANVDAAVLC